MNKFSKIIAAVLVLVLLVASVPAAYAAEYKAEPGDSVVVKFTFTNIIGIDGTIKVEDADGIVASSKITNVSELTSGGFSDNSLYRYTTEVDEEKEFIPQENVEVSYLVNLKPNAEGECKVTLTYEVTGLTLDDIKTGSVSHTVKAKAPETTKPVTTPVTDPVTTPVTDPVTTPVTKPVTTPVTKPVTTPVTKPVTSPITSEPKPTPGDAVDYTELKKQIATAEGLDESKYTAESWKDFTVALAEAKSALSSKKQSVVDNAADALADAIKALVAIDYSKLEAAIEKVNTFVENNEVANKAQGLMNALIGATELLNSNDQEAIDAAAAELEKLLAEIDELIKNLTVVETITERVEVEVEVEPSGDYCNISIHYVWPILFFISLALNLGFVALIVVYLVRRKKNQKDDTPLVDYDISDDAE